MIRNDKNFNDSQFAALYIKKHSKLLDKMGIKYARKLHDLNFTKGKILDAGCGFGQMDVAIIKKIPLSELIGLDLSEPLLDHAKKLSLENNLNDRLNFKKGDVTQIPFNDNEFDVVFNVNMVHWVNEPVLMLNEISRVLKPNGFFFLKDLRYSCLTVFENEISFAFTFNQAQKLVRNTYLKGGNFKKSLLWWEYNSV